LSGKVIPILKKINPDLLDELANDKEKSIGSFGIKFASPNGKSIDIPFKSVTSKVDYAPGFISKRIDFDYFLASRIDKQYAEFLQGTELTDANQTLEGFELTINQNGITKNIFSKLVIVADGDRSVIAKKYGGKAVEPGHYCGGIRAYYKNVSGMHKQNFIELHFLKELLPGYFWIFPLADGSANVGAGMLSKSLSKKKVNLRDAMLKAIAENPTIKDRFKNATLDGKIVGWGLPLGSKKRKISGNNFLLTGDAASVIDPFTGEGISNAMYCGMTAAAVAKECLETTRYDEKFLSRYDEIIYNRLWSELKLSHTLQKLCNYPSLFNFVINKAEKNKTFRETISCMFDDLDLREKLKQPSFYFNLIFN
jgi:flavin-dependent dehydrogenase